MQWKILISLHKEKTRKDKFADNLLCKPVYYTEAKQCLSKSSQRALSNIKMRANKKTHAHGCAWRDVYTCVSGAAVNDNFPPLFTQSFVISWDLFKWEKEPREEEGPRLQTRRDEIFSSSALLFSLLLPLHFSFFNSRSMTSNEIDPDLCQDHPPPLLIATYTFYFVLSPCTPLFFSLEAHRARRLVIKFIMGRERK